MNPPIAIIPYDPRWPRLYDEEKSRVNSVLGSNLVALEHIGSTAVVNLGAKPIVDIMAAMRDRAAADGALPALAGIGYCDVTAQGDHPEWFYCLGKSLDERIFFHLHLVKSGSDFFARHLSFRDALRADAALARRYETLKRELATKFALDRDGYTSGKTAFIEATRRVRS